MIRGLTFGLGVFAGVMGISAMAFAAANGDAIVGTWLASDGLSRVRLSDGQGVYSGRVVWLREPRFPAGDPQGAAGTPKVDRRNPDPALRDRPIMGLEVLAGLHYAGNGIWEGGTIYVPDRGKTYPCKLALAPDGALKLTVGGPVLGRTITWTRVAPVAQAGGNPAVAPSR